MYVKTVFKMCIYFKLHHKARFNRRRRKIFAVLSFTSSLAMYLLVSQRRFLPSINEDFADGIFHPTNETLTDFFLGDVEKNSESPLSIVERTNDLITATSEPPPKGEDEEGTETSFCCTGDFHQSPYLAAETRRESPRSNSALQFNVNKKKKISFDEIPPKLFSSQNKKKRERNFKNKKIEKTTMNKSFIKANNKNKLDEVVKFPLFNKTTNGTLLQSNKQNSNNFRKKVPYQRKTKFLLKNANGTVLLTALNNSHVKQTRKSPHERSLIIMENPYRKSSFEDPTKAKKKLPELIRISSKTDNHLKRVNSSFFPAKIKNGETSNYKVYLVAKNDPFPTFRKKKNSGLKFQNSHSLIIPEVSMTTNMSFVTVKNRILNKLLDQIDLAKMFSNSSYRTQILSRDLSQWNELLGAPEDSPKHTFEPSFVEAYDWKRTSKPTNLISDDFDVHDKGDLGLFKGERNAPWRSYLKRNFFPKSLRDIPRYTIREPFQIPTESNERWGFRKKHDRSAKRLNFSAESYLNIIKKCLI